MLIVRLHHVVNQHLKISTVPEKRRYGFPPIHKDVLSELEDLINAYFANTEVRKKGLPTVQYLADQLTCRPNTLVTYEGGHRPKYPAAYS